MPYLNTLNKGLAIMVSLVLCATAAATAQDKNIPKEYYSASTIPDSLKQDANVVIRYAAEEMTVKGPGRLTDKVHRISTILNEKGDYEATIRLPYRTKISSYGSIDIYVYNAQGQQIKKYHKSDMYEHSLNDDETVMSDGREYALRHTVASYPCTIELVYDETRTSFLDLGSWYISGQPEVATQKTSCKININPDIGFRFKPENTGITPIRGKQDNLDSYTWTAENIKAQKDEDGTLPWQVIKRVKFAMNKFEFDGIPGELDSWQNYGKWQAQLNADVSTLTPARIAEIKAMTDTIRTDREKARFLYRYMQKSMRYVSIQLGIGGLKPFPATFVDQKKYGDCKALVNYMGALLKAVGIPSYYAVVNAGNNEEAADPDFPSDPFNHIILCVPLKSDTTWLECTSNIQAFGKLGPFTENRRALLITEDGGKLVNTPKSTMTDNRLDGKIFVTLDADGSAKAKIDLLSTGEWRFHLNGLAAQKLDEQKKFFIGQLNMKLPNQFDIKETGDDGVSRNVSLNLEFDKFCDVNAGVRQFYRPAVMDVWQGTLPELDKRRNDFYFDFPMQTSATTVINLPQGFELESLPADVSLKFGYGDYQAGYKYDAAKNQVTAVTKFNLNSPVIPAARYNELQQYMDAIAKAQNKKLVIKRKG